MSEQQHHEPSETALPAALQQRLQALPDAMTPAHDQWLQIAARVSGSSASDQRKGHSNWWHWSKSLAAVLVLCALAALVWQQLPRSLPIIQGPLVKVGSETDQGTDPAPATTFEFAVRSILQGVQDESAGDMAWLPESAASADLQAGLDEYDLAALQLQEALVQQPDNQGLWQQLTSLQVSRMNMFAVHIL
jgi:hypothetical protein